MGHPMKMHDSQPSGNRPNADFRVIVDEDGIYDPRHPNDRLLLGMKGTMSELDEAPFGPYDDRRGARKGPELRIPEGLVPHDRGWTCKMTRSKPGTSTRRYKCSVAISKLRKWMTTKAPVRRCHRYLIGRRNQLNYREELGQ